MSDVLSGVGSGAAAGAAIGGPYGALIGGALGGVGSFLGGAAAARAKKEALKKYLEAVQSQEIANPEDYISDYQNIDPRSLQQYGAVQETALNADPTALADIQTDPRLRDAQMAALAKLGQIGDEGLSVSDLAARNELMRDVGVKQQGAQGALQQEFARRGMGGSGTELAARLASQQGDYQSAAQQAEALAVQRDSRAKAAVLESGTLAGNIQGADFKQAAEIASAKDSINRFNTANAQGVATRNVASTQGAKNSNTKQTNDVAFDNNDLINKNADQQVTGTLGQIGAKNNIKQQVGDVELKKGNINADRYTNLGQAAGQAGSTLGTFLSKYI